MFDFCVPSISRISQAKQNREIKLREYWYYNKCNWYYLCVGTVWFEFAKIKRAKIILHVKSLIFFQAAKFMGFTVVWPLCNSNKIVGLFMFC